MCFFERYNSCLEHNNCCLENNTCCLEDNKSCFESYLDACITVDEACIVDEKDCETVERSYGTDVEAFKVGVGDCRNGADVCKYLFCEFAHGRQRAFAAVGFAGFAEGFAILPISLTSVFI